MMTQSQMRKNDIACGVGVHKAKKAKGVTCDACFDKTDAHRKLLVMEKMPDGTASMLHDLILCPDCYADITKGILKIIEG